MFGGGLPGGEGPKEEEQYATKAEAMNEFAQRFRNKFTRPFLQPWSGRSFGVKMRQVWGDMGRLDRSKRSPCKWKEGGVDIL